MRKLLFFIVLLSNAVLAQVSRPALHDSLFSTYYHQRVMHFRSLPQTSGDIIFAGNSITDGAGWSELFNNKRIKNRGISGDITAGIIHRIDEIVNRKPAKVFLLIGTNDLARNITPDSVVKNILWIASYLRQQTPATRLYVQSILPVNDHFGKFSGHTGKSRQIKQVNELLRQKSTVGNYQFIDLHTPFSDAEGKLDTRYTNDGLHLTGEGYLLWKHLVYSLVHDAQKEPALLPMPQQVKWGSERFPLYAAKTIVVRDARLQKEARRLQQQLKEMGLDMEVASETSEADPFIELQLGKVEAPQNDGEAYRLTVTDKRVLLVANREAGVFSGLQTLRQLMRDGVMLQGCAITDWPAFSWRGYMVDVGRNYQSIDLLKQQIDIMSRYKLNIFHFHLTEDIAWRLAMRHYPQLTAPEHMLRDKGLYYSESELKDLIEYCRERYITLVPEIDMPGHSEAFTRAMGVNMQSDSGLAIVKNILREFCTTYEVPYLHIGADEVKITNKNFLPEVTALIHSLGKKTIGWEPGGNLEEHTIRQLWMKDGVKDKRLTYIDSRHLYLNHMDPLESVVTIFNRQIGDRISGDRNVPGATLCVWHDRRVAREDDVLRMNPVYPAMLAFSERVWRGGGQKGWVANIGDPGSKRTIEFAVFEGRLLDHHRLYFTALPFPYTEQSTTTWKFYGPYENGGDLSRKFSPEQPSFDAERTAVALQATGGTVVLRHWWYPLVEGAIRKPKEQTTWYATTKVWSAADTTAAYWIGFNNLSRSYFSDVPAKGTWDNRKSAVWVNGQVVAPPKWQRPGQKGHSEIPLTDEGYEYREPAMVSLKKGWNTVLIKLPVGSFKGEDWQNPVKWMFTFVPLKDNTRTIH
ncbi:MAG TPA: family 20 glycosylhydrolase [Chitinophagaceae bacterium]